MNNVIQQAYARAVEMRNTPGALVPSTVESAALPAHFEQYQAPSVDALLDAPPRPDHYLKVNGGIVIGKTATVFQEVDMIIDGTRIAACHMCRYGNPAVYIKSLDGASVEGTGGSFSQAVAMAKMNSDPKSFSTYQAFSLTFTVREDLIDPKTKAVVAKKGETVGYTTPKTGVAFVQKLAEEVRKAYGIRLNDSRALLGVKLVPSYGQFQGNTWWNLALELTGIYDENGTFIPYNK